MKQGEVSGGMLNLLCGLTVFFFKQKTAYEILAYWSSDVCSSDLSIGTTMALSQTMIVDDNHQPVSSGTVGELCLAGDQLTPGYWQNQEKNLTSFFHHDGRRWYLTGDLCMADEEGDIYYIGRKDSQVKIQGYRIEIGRAHV